MLVFGKDSFYSFLEKRSHYHCQFGPLKISLLDVIRLGSRTENLEGEEL